LRTLLACKTTLASAAAAFLLLHAPSAAASKNHLVNSRFDSSLAGWTIPAPSGYSVNWTDARGSEAPGAASFYAHGSAILVSTPISQCINVKSQTKYDIAFDFRWEAGFGTAEYAYPAVVFYAGSECAGQNIEAIGIAATTSTDAQYASIWQHVSTSVASPANALSMELDISVRTHVAADAQGYVDDVKLTEGVSGDADGDGIVAVADVFYLINALFAGGPSPLGPCDVNDSDWVDVDDVFYVVNYLYANGPMPK